MLPVANLLLSEYKWNLPVVLGICKTGGLLSLHFISSNASCCSFSHSNGLPFLVKSYIGFYNFCNSGQNILRKFTIPTKLLHTYTVVGDCNFCIASSLFLNGLTQTLLSFIKFMLPMYCTFVLNNWNFFGDILRQFFLPMSLASLLTLLCENFLMG